MADRTLMTRSDIRFSTPTDDAKLRTLGFDLQANDKVVVELWNGEMRAALSFREQPFESQILSRKTVRIEQVWRKNEQNPVVDTFINRCVGLLSDQGIVLFAYRVPEQDLQIVECFTAAGFKVIETLQTFEYQLPETTRDLPIGVEFAHHSDADECARIAADVFHSDRFHADPGIPNHAANELKMAWIHNSISGRADRVLVTRSAGGKITGFNACMLNEQAATIDLIGVGTAYQGQGLGRLLVRAAQSHYAGRAERLMVGTQLDNSRSIALYKSLGFNLMASSRTMHLHRH